MATFLGFLLFVAMMAAMALAVGFCVPAGDAAYKALAEKLHEKKLRRQARMQKVRC